MLPSAYRLRRRSDFSRVYAKGRSYAADLIVMYVLPTKQSSVRVGFSVSSKVGEAVVRNRTRRLLREATKEFLPQISSIYDLVIVARAKSAGATLSELTDALENVFRRARIVNPASETGQ
jgi:ribonuclease P protein component